MMAVYAALNSSPDTSNAALAPWKAVNSQLKKIHTLKYSQGCPKQMLWVAAAVFIFSVRKANFLLSTPDCPTGVLKQLVFC